MSETAALLAAAVALAAGLAAPEAGTASQYAEGVMEQVVWNRQQMGQLPMALPAVDGFIAVAD